MSELIIKDVVSPKTHPYRIKVYEVQINTSTSRGIWYCTKNGWTYYAALAVKENDSGPVPVFRVITLNEGLTFIQPVSIILDIYPADCTILSELIVRAQKRSEHLFDLKQVIT